MVGKSGESISQQHDTGGRKEPPDEGLSPHNEAALPLDRLSDVITLCQQGEEPRRIFAAVIEELLRNKWCIGCTIQIRDASFESDAITSCSGGSYFPLLPSGDNAPQREGLVEGEAEHDLHVCQIAQGYLYTQRIHNLGAPLGTLSICSSTPLNADAIAQIRLCAQVIAMVSERQKLTATVQNFLDRLQVLGHLNTLISSNAQVPAIAKSIARECAFRFAADVALTMTISSDPDYLEILKGGSYGCNPSGVPPLFSLHRGIVAQTMRIGGHISLQNIAMYNDHEFGFLQANGIVALDVHSLEVRGEPLGMLVLGFRRPVTLSRSEVNAFQEFCQAAAVALGNARNQERLSAYSEKLQELVDVRTKELERQTALAQEANQAKSQFLANMSHELRTPLTAIIGYSSVLKDGIFGPCNERQQEALNAICRSSEHLKNLIDDVLNLARVESGKENPEPRDISVADLLQQSYKLMMQTAMTRGVSIEQPQLPKEMREAAIYADPKHTQQIIINLMSNAVKYTPPSGRVWVTAEQVTDTIKINIHDTGVGISASKQATLFERFTRGEDAYSKEQEGTGIGLDLTKHLVELNGGRIGVESTEGKGSTFWFMLPIAHSQPCEIVESTSATPSKTTDLSGLTMMVVDDNPNVCTILETIFSNVGATVHVATSVQDGLTLLNTSQPDIIVTDMAMPRESGLTLIERIRATPNDIQNLPILVLSACAFDNDKNTALAAGASAFMAKPFNPAELLQRVRELTLAHAMGLGAKV
jgi:signal transduction histidine kinase/ActR/RegA family two-component response regulator